MEKTDVPKEIMARYINGKDVRFQGNVVGKARDFVGIYQDADKREYWKGAERIDFDWGEGQSQIRFVYFAKAYDAKRWTWIGRNVCLTPEQYVALINEIRKKGWDKPKNPSRT